MFEIPVRRPPYGSQREGASAEHPFEDRGDRIVLLTNDNFQALTCGTILEACSIALQNRLRGEDLRQEGVGGSTKRVGVMGLRLLLPLDGMACAARGTTNVWAFRSRGGEWYESYPRKRATTRHQDL